MVKHPLAPQQPGRYDSQRQAVILQMGRKYILHPANYIKRISVPARRAGK